MVKSATEFWLLFNFRCNSMYCTNCKSSFQYTESDWMGRGYKTPYFWGNSSLEEVNALHIKTLVSWTDFLKSLYLLTHTLLYQYYLMRFSIALNYTNCYMKHNFKCSWIMLVPIHVPDWFKKIPFDLNRYSYESNSFSNYFHMRSLTSVFVSPRHGWKAN